MEDKKLSTYAIAPMESFLGKKKRKKPKKLTLGKGKMKSTKKITEEQDILNLLRSASVDKWTITDVIDQLKMKNKELSDMNKAKFYSEILNINYNISRISISDILGGKKLSSIIQIGDLSNFGKKCFTTDKLYWLSFIYFKYNKFSEIQNYADFSNLKVSVSTIAIKNHTYNEGYIQDFNKYFTFIGSAYMPDATQKKIIVNTIKSAGDYNEKDFNDDYIAKVWNYGTFVYNNIEYKSCILNNDIIFTLKSDTSQEEAIKIFDNVSYFSSTDIKKAKAELDVKKANDADNGIYISQNIRLTDFAPSVVYLKNYMQTEVLIEYDIDLVLLYTYLQKKNAEKKPKTIGEYLGDIVLDDKDINVIYSFFLIMFLTRFKEAEGTFSTNVKSFLEKYATIKDNLAKARQIFDIVLTIIEKFYDAFKNKINFDPIRNLYQYILKYTYDINKFFNSFNFEEIQEFLRTYDLTNIFAKLTNAINNRDWLYNVFKRITNLTEMINNLTDADEIVKNIRHTGILAYKIFYNQNNSDALNLIWKIRTPSSFLGNLFGTTKAFDVDVRDTLDKVLTKYLKETEATKEEIANSIAIMSITSDNEGDIILGLAHLLSNVKDYPNASLIFSSGDKLSEVFQNWFNTQAAFLLNDQKKKILILYLMALNKKVTYSPENISNTLADFINSMIKSFNAYIDKIKSKKDEKLAKYGAEIAELEARRDKLLESKDEDEMSMVSTIPSGLPEEIKKMKKDELMNYIRSTTLKIPLEIQQKLKLNTIDLEKYKTNQQNYIKTLRGLGILDDVILEFNPSIKVSSTSAPTIKELVSLFDLNQKKINTLLSDSLTKKVLEESSIRPIPVSA